MHGQQSRYRLSNLIKYSFFKNMALAMCNFLFQFYSQFSGL